MGRFIWMIRKETEYSDSSFCDCDCCKIWMRGANFWEECPRLVFGVLLVFSMISTTLELRSRIPVCRESIGIIHDSWENLGNLKIMKCSANEVEYLLISINLHLWFKFISQLGFNKRIRGHSV